MNGYTLGLDGRETLFKNGRLHPTEKTNGKMNANMNNLIIGGKNPSNNDLITYDNLFEKGLGALNTQWGGNHNNGVVFQNVSVKENESIEYFDGTKYMGNVINLQCHGDNYKGN